MLRSLPQAAGISAAWSPLGFVWAPHPAVRQQNRFSDCSGINICYKSPPIFFNPCNIPVYLCKAHKWHDLYLTKYEWFFFAWVEKVKSTIIYQSVRETVWYKMETDASRLPGSRKGNTGAKKGGRKRGVRRMEKQDKRITCTERHEEKVSKLHSVSQQRVR